MDTISAILDVFHLNASVFERARFCGNWAMTHAGGEQASFHLVTAGECWLDRLDGDAPMRLGEGDLLVMPRDAPHRLGPASEIGTDAEPDRRPLDEAADGPGLICGYFAFDDGVRNPILDALPDYLLIPRDRMGGSEALPALVHLLSLEAARDEGGSDAMVNRLSDALFVEVVRFHLAHSEAPTGLFAALADPVAGPAIRALHAAPAEQWTLERLAKTAATSRSALTERFAQTLGTAPMSYLFSWRMQLARRWLREGLPVARVAERCGYATEAGFSKAFSRHFGVGPGAVRRGRGAA